MNLRRDAVVFAQEPEQQVLGADIVVLEPLCLFDGVYGHFLARLRLWEFPKCDHLGGVLDQLLDFEAHAAQVDTKYHSNLFLTVTGYS